MRAVHTPIFEMLFVRMSLCDTKERAPEKGKEKIETKKRSRMITMYKGNGDGDGKGKSLNRTPKLYMHKFIKLLLPSPSSLPLLSYVRLSGRTRRHENYSTFSSFLAIFFVAQLLHSVCKFRRFFFLLLFFWSLRSYFNRAISMQKFST